MTKKDYELIARCFKIRLGVYADSDSARLMESYNVVRDTAITMANMLQRTAELSNSRFDRVKFLKACGLT